jgi:hypothetical protein
MHLKWELTSSELLVGEWNDLLETKDNDIRRVYRIDTIREKLGVLPNKIVRFGAIDIPRTD